MLEFDLLTFYFLIKLMSNVLSHVIKLSEKY